MENQVEIWKDIPDYEGIYQVSNLGQVKSLNYHREKRQKILKLLKNKKGYLMVCLCKKSKKKLYKANVLVAIAFLGHVPDKTQKLVVDHIDENKTNNQLSNLQVITQRENTSRSVKKRYSKYVGVSFNKKTNKWKSTIVVNNKKIHLGYFENELEASNYYQTAILALKNGTEIQVKTRKHSSKYKGVTWSKFAKKWVVRIVINKKLKYLGYFKTEEEANDAKIAERMIFKFN